MKSQIYRLHVDRVTLQSANAHRIHFDYPLALAAHVMTSRQVCLREASAKELQADKNTSTTIRQENLAEVACSKM
jgi:hypothetical protein